MFPAGRYACLGLWVITMLSPVGGYCLARPARLKRGSEDTLPLKFRHINIDKGLPDHTVNFVLQDKLGFIWLATTNGVCRYDGRKFLSYRRDIHQPDSLSSNGVTSLCQDVKGTIWAATYYGLNAMREDYRGFRHYFHDAKDPASLISDQLSTLTEDRQGRLWVGTFAGLDRLVDRDTGRFIHYNEAPDQRWRALSEYVYFVFEDREGQIWASDGKGLRRYVSEADAFENYVLKLPRASEEVAFYSVFQDEGGLLWFGTNIGVVSHHPGTGLTETFLGVTGDDRTAPMDIVSIAEDDSGVLWMGSYADGLALLDRRERRFHRYRHVLGDPSSLPLDGVAHLMRDHANLMWVGTRGGGVSLWNPLTKTFQQYTRIPGKADSLNHEVPWGFAEMDDGTIWVATDAGLNRWRFGSNRFESVVHDPKRPDGLGPGPVYYIERNKAGKLWLTVNGSLELFDPQTLTSRKFRNDPKDPTSIPRNACYALLPDRDERVWVGLTGSGLALFDADKGMIKHYMPDETKQRWLTTPFIGHIIAARDGHLWIGSQDGVFHFDQEKDDFTHYPERVDGTGLSSKLIYRMYEDERGHLWIGTNGGGLNRLYPDRRVVYYTTREGLPDDSVLTVGGDRSGHIWISTVRGLCRLDPETGAVRNFDITHGLQSNEFNEGSFFRDHIGRLYFGGGNGFNVFDPDEIGQSDIAPSVYFTSVKRFDQPLEVPFSVALLQDLKLSWEDTVFSLEFAALDYANPEGNRYMYQMQGLNDHWINLGNRNNETFTNLKPGNYVLRVKGANSDGRWSDKETVLNLEITTPPWLTPLAIASYAITSIFLTGLLLFNHRRRQVARIKAHLALRRSEEQLKHALWGTGDELWDLDIRTGRVHRSNMLHVRGDGSDYTALKSVFDQMHPDDVQPTNEALQAHIEGKTEYYESCYRLPGEDGGWVWIMDRGRIVERDPNGAPLRIAGTNKNIDSIKRTEERLKLIAKAFENTSDGVVITDCDLRILATNPAYTRITGRASDEAKGQYFGLMGEEEGSFQQSDLVREALDATGHWAGELWEEHAKGGRFPVSANLDAVRDQHGNTTHFVCVFTDITFVKQAEEKMRHLANFDQLTALPNRNLFHDRLSHAISLASREQSKIALLYLDLDRFKNINDSLGHAAGDQLLQAVADRVRRCLREVDSIARLGGDEFTVILEGMAGPGEIAAVSEKVLRSLDRAFVLQGQQIVVTPSIGISVFPNDGQDVETLLKCADTAMYHAKRIGGNTYQFFTPEMNREVVERLSLESEMRMALEREEFVVYYQAKFDTRNRRINGFEALVRWEHPGEGIVSPAKFIPIAEETGLIVPLGLWVLRRACLDAAAWRERGFENARVAVNLSALQFRQSDLLACVTQILEETGLPGEFLELEITEGTLLNNIDQAISTLLKFRELGLTLALDDFGTGFSSLGYLKRLPIQTLKIDRSFVNEVTEDPEDASIVTSIIDLAHNLKISVVAEGVERADQLAFLEARGCELVQGYLFSRPLPRAEATELLLSHALKAS